ncbi:MAG: dienelactone hydrolase family protein [Chthoniobacterales bacterium]
MIRFTLRALGLWMLLSIFGERLDAAGERVSEIRPTALSFQSGGREIRADYFAPAGPKSKRTVIVLHGAGGTLFDGPAMRRVARSLAEAGDSVYVLHYFNRTGTIGARDSDMQKHFGEWLQTLRDGIVWVHGREKNGPIGIYGYSLGGFLSLAAGSDNSLVGAVAEQAGGVWNSQEKRIGKMPPVLMVHGLQDTRVPFEKYAKPLQQLLRERGGKVETDFVQGQGHVFSEEAMKEVRPKVVSFFARKLR